MTSLTDQKPGDQYPNSTFNPTYVQDDSHSAVHNGPIFGNVSDQENEDQYPNSTADPAWAQGDIHPVIHNSPMVFGNVPSDRLQAIATSSTDQEHEDQYPNSTGELTCFQDDSRMAVHNGPIYGNVNHLSHGGGLPKSDGARNIPALPEKLPEVPMLKGTFYQRRSRGPIFNSCVVGDVNTYQGPKVTQTRKAEQLYRSRRVLSEHDSE
ncbi:hypothetical protein EST38_g11980 [Candolleomyces aberdarensis]|uniref:Uncharacterized protein n=1 Tax=Candolleomyces aberdarensis TaxID=2316362 RepID=A0A4Q2D3K1_9AGAR|nr:hypothetical protein EST38_g11980 [Candolleomyces aberdarensis]